MKIKLTALLTGLPIMLAANLTQAADEAAKPYPLDSCVVSGEKLGEMGDPYVFTYEGQQIKLCCKSCLKKFDKDPQTYLKKLETKEGKQTDSGHEGHGH